MSKAKVSKVESEFSEAPTFFPVSLLEKPAVFYPQDGDRFTKMELKARIGALVVGELRFHDTGSRRLLIYNASANGTYTSNSNDHNQWLAKWSRKTGTNIGYVGGPVIVMARDRAPEGTA